VTSVYPGPRISAKYGFARESEVNPRRLFMPSRFRVFSSIFLFALLVCAQLLAQSNSASSAQPRARALKRSAEFSGALQTPALTFATVVPYLSGENGANAVAIADVNNDGKPDLVVTNWCPYSSCTTPGPNVGVLLGNGDGTFQTAVVYASGGLFADAIAIADVNGDGKPDLIVANCGSSSQNNCVSTSGSGDVSVLLGNGDGTFQTALLYSLGASGATSVAVADVNGDGKPDLIVATGSSTAGLVGVLLGNGNGTFQTEVTYSSGGLSPLAVAAANLGNGHIDVVVANQCAADCSSSNVGVLVGNGEGTFQTVVTYGSGGLFPDSVAIADVNRDGKPDVMVANSSTSLDVDNGNVGVLLGNGDGTLQTAVAYGSGAFGAASVAVADVNGDGKLDLVVANCSGTASSCIGTVPGDVGVLLGNGNGTFQTAVSYGSGANTPFGVAVADVNGDGRPDIVAANCSSSNCGQGTGYAGVLINQSTPWLVYASLAQQVDYFGLGSSDFTVWRPSTGTFYSQDVSGTPPLIEKWGLSTDIPVIGDYDGDGKTDVAAWRPSNGTWYIIPSSTGKWYGVQFGAEGDVPVPGDYDGDGRTDIAVWRPSNGTWFVMPSTTGKPYRVQFGMQGDVPVPGDYDGDGKTDIAVWRPSNQIWYILLSSTGKLVKYKWGLPTDKPVPADYDGDGKTDIAMWRPAAEAIWFIVPSSTNVPYHVQWGTTGDVPVPRDYDGDLKADVAVWRPSTGFWWVIESHNQSILTKQWGLPTDIPLNKPVGQ
jgi:hypothetical protein